MRNRNEVYFMVLCFDIGNTDIDVGVFENDVHTFSFNIPYKKAQTCWDYIPVIKASLDENNINPRNVKGCVLCSVVQNTTQGVFMAMDNIFGYEPLLFKNDDIADIKVRIGNPQEVGVDIIAGCLAVKYRYKLPAIVIDMGTATTLTAMDEEGALLGVSILTGVMTTLKALRDSTGLPIDESLTPPPHVIGTKTADSIASGIVYGSAYRMDGMIKGFEKEIGKKCNIYATGGISKVIMPLCECDCNINDDLLLEGLYMYYKAAQTKQFDL